MNKLPDNFTPLFDNLPAELDIYHSILLGFILRCTKLNKKRCYASLETIAAKTRMSPRTVLRRLADLIEDEWIIDLTPGRRNKPHEYITGPRFKDWANDANLTRSHTEPIKSNSTLTDSLFTMTSSPDGLTMSQAETDSPSLEETKKEKKVINREINLNRSNDLGTKYLKILLENLKLDLPKSLFDQYIASLTLAGLENNILQLSTESPELLVWLNDRVLQTANNISRGFHPKNRIHVEFIHRKLESSSSEAINGQAYYR